MSGQRGTLVRGWGAAGAAVLLAGSLSGCWSADAGSQVDGRSARTPVETLKPAASTTDPSAASSPLTLPDWLPAELPLPDEASVIAVRDVACSVTFMDWGSDALLEGASLSDRADANGLQSRLVSSVSDAEPVVQETSEFGYLEDAPVATVLTHVVVLRMQRTAAAGEPAFDATLTLTSRGDGSVIGEYALADDAC